MEKGAEAGRTGSIDPALAATSARSSIRTGTDTQKSDAPTIADTSGADGDKSLSQVRASLSGGDTVLVDGVSRYDARALLGVGGMGEVRLHVDRRVGRAVAMKTMHTEHTSSVSLARFVREARVQGQLEHPTIVPVYDLGADSDGRPFFTMKRVRGQTLATVITELQSKSPEHVARFTRRKLLTAFTQVCQAVDYAHARGVLHRDLKPGNIMLGDFGEVYLLDWGLAKLLGESSDDDDRDTESAPLRASSASMTRAGDLMGTPMYMAPEQIHGETVDARADVFALGAILFELLTLSPFRPAESMAKILVEVRKAETKRPSDFAPGIPPELDAICLRALATDRDARCASAREIADAVDRFLEGDRDDAARQALAKDHLTEARALLDRSPGPGGRAQAIRAAMKAFALSPEDGATHELLLSMVVDGSGALPPEAEAEFEDGVIGLRRQGGIRGIVGFVSWLACLPMAMLIGVRSWTPLLAMAGITIVCIALSLWLLRISAMRSRLGILSLAILSASAVSLSSAWLGPFVLVPLAGCATAMMFLVHSTKEERPAITAVWTLALVAPFLVEWLGWVPRAYTFVESGILLHARALALPPVATMILLIYTSVSFLVLLVIFVGRLRDDQRAAERKLFVQAWYLRQLFPVTGKSAG